jgi:hypothetical protein
MNFDDAAKAAKAYAAIFIGAEVKQIVTAAYGGSDEDDAECDRIIETCYGSAPETEIVIYYTDDEEGDGEIKLLMFAEEGEKFVAMKVDDGDGPGSIGTEFFLAK